MGADSDSSVETKPIGTSIAVVDDDPTFTGYVSTWLQTLGYSVDVYHSGSALLDSLRSGAQPHVVLLDVMMPDVDGLQTLRTIRQVRPATQVIMLSGRNVPSTVVEAVRLGAADYVLKPGDPDGLGEVALEAAVAHALERESLSSEVARLRAQLEEDPDGTQPCWSSGPGMQRVMAMVDRIADSDVPVLLRGESGVGKEVIAHELHRRSDRRSKPYVKVNCAALPADLLESELFGHERGAFTGAGTTRLGKFEFAQKGTILLDEIGEMPAALQAKLLHVVQDQTFTKLGSNRPIEADVRVIAATNRDLDVMMRAGTFREDLYYRLQVIELHIPPLRERQEEILPLVEFFLTKYARMYRRPVVRPSPELRALLRRYSWPGNIRELENMMKRFVVLQDEQLIMSELEACVDRAAQPAVAVQSAVMVAPSAAPPVVEPAVAGVGAPLPATAAAPGSASAEGEREVASADEDGAGDTVPAATGLLSIARAAALKAERQAILEALTRFRWNRRKVADYLDVSYKTLLTKMKECGISEGADG